MNITVDTALVTSNQTIGVINEVVTPVVTTESTKIAEVSTNTYVLSTGGVYSGNINNGIPTWLTDAITAQLTTGTLNINQLLADLQALVQNIELGVNQSIASIQNDVLSQSTYLTTVKSELNDDIAVAISQYDTLVTPELAKAVKIDALGAIRDQVQAWALDITTVYADANLASATQVDLLVSTIDDPSTGVVGTATKLYTGYTTVGLNPDGSLNAGAGQLGILSASIGDAEVNITSLEQVTVGEFTEWSGTGTPELGMFKYEGGAWYQYRGGTLGTYGDGWVVTPVSAALSASSAVNNELETFVSDTYDVFVEDIQGQVDQKAETFYQATAPHAEYTNIADNSTYNAYIGDLWKDTADNVEYIYSKIANGLNWDYVWVEYQVPDIVFDTIDTKKTIYTGTAAPTAANVNDMWIPSVGVVGYDAEEIYVWDGAVWGKPTSYTDDTAANRNKQVFRSPLAAPPAGADEGDLWFVTNYYYTAATGTASSTTKSEYGILTKEYINGAWVNVAVEDRGNYAGISWAGYASSLLTGPNGEITGWQYSDGGVIGGNSTSEFKISAETFRIDNGSGTGLVPFEIVNNSEGTPEINFKGKVTFASVTGTQGVALTENLPTYTEGIVDPTSTTEPIQSVYLNTTDKSLWTFVGVSVTIPTGWVPGGTPGALTASDLAAAGDYTTINGSQIITGSINAESIDVDTIFADEILMSSVTSGVISNASTPGGSDYTMKIDFKNGEIHIV